MNTTVRLPVDHIGTVNDAARERDIRHRGAARSRSDFRAHYDAGREAGLTPREADAAAFRAIGW